MEGLAFCQIKFNNKRKADNDDKYQPLIPDPDVYFDPKLIEQYNIQRHQLAQERQAAEARLSGNSTSFAVDEKSSLSCLQPPTIPTSSSTTSDDDVISVHKKDITATLWLTDAFPLQVISINRRQSV